MCSELVTIHVINHDALHKLPFYGIGIGNGIGDTGPVFTWYQHRVLQYRIPPVIKCALAVSSTVLFIHHHSPALPQH